MTIDTLDDARPQTVNLVDDRLVARAAYEIVETTAPDAPNLAEWAIIDAAEERMACHVATSAKEAEGQLWTSLQHGSLRRTADCAAINEENIDFLLSREQDLDFNDRLVLRVVQYLRAQSKVDWPEWRERIADWRTKRAALNAYLSTETNAPSTPEWLEGETQHCATERAAWKRVLSYPAPNLAIVLEKMDLVMKKYGEAEQEDFDAVHEDVMRLAG